MSKFNVGDIVYTTENEEGFYVFYVELPVGTPIVIAEIWSNGGGYEGRVLPEEFNGIWQSFCDEDVTTEPPAEDTPSPKLTLNRAIFLDEDGNKVHIKRSKCRHYYVKVGSSTQERVSLDEIKKVVGAL